MAQPTPWRTATTLLGICLTVIVTTACKEEWEKLTSSGGGGGDKSEKEETVLALEDSEPAKDAGERSEPPPEPVVHLDPGSARTRGQAKYKCWDNCWWVVWCGHNICDGSWTWTFPASGRYEITWLNVKEKCAGSPAYELRVNGRGVAGGRVPRHGGCGGCDGSGRWVNRSLGTVNVEQGDNVTLWVQNDFACGIDGPGAYAAHRSLRADLR